MFHDGRMSNDGLGCLCPIDEAFNYEGEFWDDLSGKHLRKEGVIEARKLEIKCFHEHTVYIKTPLTECHEVTGKGPIGVKWIDINKGDEVNEEYRSRLVAQEINYGKTENLFAATPPLEAKKTLFSLAVTEGFGYGPGWQYKLEFIDVKRAYFYAPAKRDVYVKLPDEDYEEGMCGKLNKSMYGTRDAAYNWEVEYVRFMNSVGFVHGKTSPCIFYHSGKDIRCVIYGDDFTLLGSEVALDWFRKSIKATYEVSVKGRLGADDKDDKSVRLLNRVIEWTKDGISYEADQRHAEIIVKQLGTQASQAVSSPGHKINPKLFIGNDGDLLKPEQASMYRALSARANYLSQDRSDIRFSVKELCRRMSQPRQIDWKQLLVMGRYLIGRMRVINKFDYQKNWKIIDTWTDTDHAGCMETRKSTSGGIIMLGNHPLKHWANTQSIVSLSSGEAEYYGCVRAGSATMGYKSMLEDLNVKDKWQRGGA